MLFWGSMICLERVQKRIKGVFQHSKWVAGYLFHIELRNESHRSCEGGGVEPLVKLTERHVVHGLGHVGAWTGNWEMWRICASQNRSHMNQKYTKKKHFNQLTLVLSRGLLPSEVIQPNFPVFLFYSWTSTVMKLVMVAITITAIMMLLLHRCKLETWVLERWRPGPSWI